MKRRRDNEIMIRAAEPEDFARARAIQWSVGWKDAPQTHRIWPAQDPEWINRRHFREFVAEVDGIVAARLGLEAYCPPFAELVNLCVLPEYRRHGLGQMLTRTAMREAASMGFTALFLQTEIDNHDAHRLYASQEWVPTAYGKMLRMVKLMDYPLLSSFKRAHPLTQYRCMPAADAPRKWIMEWYAYVTEDNLKLTLEGGASRSDSDGAGPAISAIDWSVEQGGRRMNIRLNREQADDLEPGDHVELEIAATNYGTRQESGVFQMALPPGVRIVEPETNANRSFTWSLEPGETLRQPCVVRFELEFDSRVLWYLNYASVPVSVEAYWQGQRALLSASIPMAAPPPT